MVGDEGKRPISIGAAKPSETKLKKFQHYFGNKALVRLALELDVPADRQQDVLRRYAQEVVKKMVGQVKNPESEGLLLDLHYPEDLRGFLGQLEELVVQLDAIPEILDLDWEDFELCQNLISRIRADVVRLVEQELDEKGMERKVGVLAQKYGEGGFGKVFACRLGNENLVAKIMTPMEYDEWMDPPTYFEYPELVEATRASENLVRYHGTLDFETNYGANTHLDFYEELKEAKALDDYLYWDFRFEGDNHYRKMKSFLGQVCLPMLKGVKALHDRKLVHCDLKGGNVWIIPNGERPEVRVGDIGLVRRSGFKSNAPSMAGSPAYMSPEQVMSKPITEKSDIYSLGMVLYYIFGGKMSKDTVGQARLGIRELDVSKLECPEMMKSLVSRCVSLSPENRPTIDGMIQEVGQMMEDPDFEADIRSHLPEQRETQPAGDVFGVGEDYSDWGRQKNAKIEQAEEGQRAA